MSFRQPIFNCFLKQTINYSHVTYFIRFYRPHSIKVVEIGQAASSAKVKPNPGRVITVFQILCKLGFGHALINMLEEDVHLAPETLEYNRFLQG